MCRETRDSGIYSTGQGSSATREQRSSGSHVSPTLSVRYCVRHRGRVTAEVRTVVFPAPSVVVLFQDRALITAEENGIEVSCGGTSL